MVLRMFRLIVQLIVAVNSEFIKSKNLQQASGPA